MDTKKKLSPLKNNRKRRELSGRKEMMTVEEERRKVESYTSRKKRVAGRQ